jgi:hypothetical protein
MVVSQQQQAQQQQHSVDHNMWWRCGRNTMYRVFTIKVKGWLLVMICCFKQWAAGRTTSQG